MKKKSLEMVLQQIPLHPEPKSHLEQYNTPANIAADVLFFAHSLGDIKEKKVIDLGCGTGIFAIGAKLLGAKKAIGIDVDEKAIEIAQKTSIKLDVSADFQVCEINDFNEKCDTILQNPPFGAQKRHADRPFIKKALALSKVAYSLHLTKTQKFIEREANKFHTQVTHKKRYNFKIPHTFKFHTEEKKGFDVTMFRIEKIGDKI